MVLLLLVSDFVLKSLNSMKQYNLEQLLYLVHYFEDFCMKFSTDDRLCNSSYLTSLLLGKIKFISSPLKSALLTLKLLYNKIHLHPNSFTVHSFIFLIFYCVCFDTTFILKKYHLISHFNSPLS